MAGEMLPGTWVVQSFTPWAASGTAALQLEFLAALGGGGLAEKGAVKTALRKYAKWASPVLAALADTTQAAADEFAARQPWSVESGGAGRAPQEDGEARSNRL